MGEDPYIVSIGFIINVGAQLTGMLDGFMFLVDRFQMQGGDGGIGQEVAGEQRDGGD
jgi:hypothetical protein